MVAVRPRSDHLLGDMELKNDSIVLVQPKDRILDTLLGYFKEALIQGKLKPGDRLLSERDLAAQFQISRASLREALRALEMLGMLSVEPGKGTFVLPPRPETITGVLGLIVSLRPTMSESILEVRIIIECEAARLASLRASPEELAYIKSTLTRMHNPSSKEELGAAAAHADFEFHKGIIKATHNGFLAFLYDALEILLIRSHTERWVDSLRYVPNAAEVVSQAHEGIYEAVKKGDPDISERLMRDHFGIVASRKADASQKE